MTFSVRFASLVAVLVCIACNADRLSETGGAKRRLSIATGGTGGVYYPYGGGIAKIISEHLDRVTATAEVTAGSVDNLKFLKHGKSDIAFTLADTLDDALKGRGAFEGTGQVPARALAVLYTNYTQIVTLEGTGITSLRDLKDRVVATGAPGSGTEILAFRILNAVGLDPARDIRRQSLGVAAAVEAIKDGKVHAFFWSGGLPTGAILDLAHTPRVELRLLACDAALPGLHRTYGPHVYRHVSLPASAYPDLTSEVPTIGVSNLLVVAASLPDSLAYDLTRLLFEKQRQLAAIHPEAGKLSIESAVADSPAEFHPGAIRYYREKGAWPAD